MLLSQKQTVTENGGGMLAGLFMRIKVFQISVNKLAALLDTVNASQRVRGGVKGIVDKLVYCGGGDVYPCVGGGIINVDLILLVHDCAVGENNI